MLYFVALKFQFSEKLSMHQERSMELYLDRQLIIKMIDHLTTQAGIQNIIHDAIKYLALEDIIILNPKVDFEHFQHNDIWHYMKNNIHDIELDLAAHKLLKRQINENTDDAKQIFIQYLDDKQKHWIIIYVESVAHKLNKHDLEIMTNAITPLLKIAHTNIIKHSYS